MMEMLPSRCVPIAKKEILYMGTFGLACWLSGLIFIDRKKREESITTLTEVAESLHKENVSGKDSLVRTHWKTWTLTQLERDLCLWAGDWAEQSKSISGGFSVCCVLKVLEVEEVDVSARSGADRSVPGDYICAVV